MKKGILSFDDDKGDGEADATTNNTATETSDSRSAQPFKKRGLRPNATVVHQPKALTKSALLKEAQLKEALRKEYAQLQEAVKATEFVLPFVFYDGKNAPGGMCRMKKGDHIWLFLERARKVGADRADKTRRDWARISVDDLMLVKGDIIIPQVSVSNVTECGPADILSSTTTFTTSSSIVLLDIWVRYLCTLPSLHQQHHGTSCPLQPSERMTMYRRA